MTPERAPNAYSSGTLGALAQQPHGLGRKPPRLRPLFWQPRQFTATQEFEA